MPFSSKTAAEAGRKSSRKGSPNRATKAIREALGAFVDDNYAEFQSRAAKLDDKDFCSVYLAAAEYVLPKLSRVEQDYTAMIESYRDLSPEDKALLKSLVNG